MPDIQKTADPCVMVIFGATGDLTNRKLCPALHNPAREKFLPGNFAIVGIGRQEMTTKEFREQTHADLKEFVGENGDAVLLDWFCEHTFYTGGDFDDDKKLFKDIKDLLAKVCAEHSI